jgi:hypothetical protein
MKSAMASRLAGIRATATAAALAAAACAHSPALRAGEGPGGATSDATTGREQPARAFVTGSMIVQPVGRFGVPLSASPVKIYYWRGDPTRASFLDLSRALPGIDLERQTHPDEKRAAQQDVGP